MTLRRYTKISNYRPGCNVQGFGFPFHWSTFACSYFHPGDNMKHKSARTMSQQLRETIPIVLVQLANIKADNSY